MRTNRARALARSSALPLLLLGAVAFATAGCGPDFARESELKTLRILALRAEPPEARPGELVQLDALTWVPGVGIVAGGVAEHPVEDDAAVELPRYAWRACFLATDLGSTFGGGDFGGSGDEPPPASCFDMAQTMTLEELAAALAPGGGGGEGSGQVELPDLGQLALDLGEQPVALLPTFPLSPFPGPPSFCFNLPEKQRAEQGGREMWISGLRLMVSLRVSANGETVEANKRVLLRPDAAEIPAEAQGQPFRTPRLCQDAAAAQRLCARNLNPPPPGMTTPNGEWSGSGPIRLEPGQQVKLRPDLPVADDLQDQQPYVAMKTCGEQLADERLRAAGGEYERLESRYYAWFSDGGRVVEQVTLLGIEPGDRDSAWAAPDEVSGELQHTLVLVARDGRGGVSWSTFTLLVDGP